MGRNLSYLLRTAASIGEYPANIMPTPTKSWPKKLYGGIVAHVRKASFAGCAMMQEVGPEERFKAGAGRDGGALRGGGVRTEVRVLEDKVCEDI